MRSRFLFIAILMAVQAIAFAQDNPTTDQQRERFIQELADFAKDDLERSLLHLGFRRDGSRAGDPADSVIAESIKRAICDEILRAWQAARGYKSNVEIKLGSADPENPTAQTRLIFESADPSLVAELAGALGIDDQQVVLSRMRITWRYEHNTRTIKVESGKQLLSPEDIRTTISIKLAAFARDSSFVKERNLPLPEVEMEQDGKDSIWFLRTGKREYAQFERHRFLYSINYGLRINPDVPTQLTAYVRFEHWTLGNGLSPDRAKFRYDDEEFVFEELAGNVERNRKIAKPIMEYRAVTDIRPPNRRSSLRVSQVELIKHDASEIRKRLRREAERLSSICVGSIQE